MKITLSSLLQRITGIALIVCLPISVTQFARAQSANYFGDCASDDGIYAVGGKWWYLDAGDARREGIGWVYGGVYHELTKGVIQIIPKGAIREQGATYTHVSLYHKKCGSR